jgi:hypothetical protein
MTQEKLLEKIKIDRKKDCLELAINSFRSRDVKDVEEIIKIAKEYYNYLYGHEKIPENEK